MKTNNKELSFYCKKCDRWFNSKIFRENKTTYCRFCGKIIKADKKRYTLLKFKIKQYTKINSVKPLKIIKKCSSCNTPIKNRNTTGLCWNCYVNKRWG